MEEIIGHVREGESPTVIARVRTDDGFPLENAQVETWDFDIFDLSSDTPSVAIFTILDQTADLLVDLTTGNGWNLDAIGGNFFHRINAADFGCVGNKSYRFVWTIHTLPDTFGDIVVSALIGIKSPYGEHAP